MAEDKILQRAYDILNDAPWQSTDELIELLQHLNDFHLDLVRKHYNADSVDVLARKLSGVINTELSENPEFKTKLLDYTNLVPDSRKSVILHIYDVLKKAYAPDADELVIKFEDSDTTVTATQDRQRGITFFNVGTNPRLNNYKDLIKVSVHEFTHLLQDLGLATMPRDAYDLSCKYYVSFASFKNETDETVRDLCNKCWWNNITEKEPIAVGRYVMENMGI